MTAVSTEAKPCRGCGKTPCERADEVDPPLLDYDAEPEPGPSPPWVIRLRDADEILTRLGNAQRSLSALSPRNYGGKRSRALDAAYAAQLHEMKHCRARLEALAISFSKAGDWTCYDCGGKRWGDPAAHVPEAVCQPCYEKRSTGEHENSGEPQI